MKRFLLIFVLCLAVMSGYAQHHRSQRRPHHDRIEYITPVASQEQVRMIVDVIEKQSFDENKLEIAKLSVSLVPLYTSDLAKIASKFSFDSNRLAFLKYAYSTCADPERYPALKSVFEFGSNYDELLDYIYK